MKKVALYCLPTSVEYPMAREYLSQNNIPFETYTFNTEEQIKAQTNQDGNLQLVIYEVDDKGQAINPQVIIGFDKERIEDILKN